MLDIFKEKITWVLIGAITIPTGGFFGAKLYQSYLKKTGTSAIQGVADREAQNVFAACMSAVDLESYSDMKDCDRYYLEYLPEKTSPDYREKTIEFEKLQVDQELVKAYYDKIVLLRAEFELEPYEPLDELSNGKITVGQ
ncbi:hypothetical protein R7Q39_14980 [Vibrio sp. 947]|uniref:hypothetical protein n=1 Tax=Vibrio TaxID=662 RepID=UPI001CDD08E8|nr:MULTISPECIES: hypothetical protein [Vibrio]MCA2418852.1 hypothetical protein [Vibrio alginolyticus]MCA2443478.1 hypothetical protein [Vibrio alginolyticus]MDW1926726.1 hypothetical protein [Vibrio sp. 947]MDW1948091.1 hypothetical protein [Vibrio sp. 812(2023)]MDW1990894.1 hypothetical protein [Vibrio sp. 780]